MKRILVAVDGSVHADKAAELAIDLAKRYGASLYFIHVIAGYSSYERFGEAVEGVVNPKELTEIASRSIQTGCERYLREAEERARAAGVKKTEPVCRSGDPADQILHFAKENRVDLIAMGSRGLGRFSRMFMGSVSNKVAHHAGCTVIIVK